MQEGLAFWIPGTVVASPLVRIDDSIDCGTSRDLGIRAL